MIKKSIVDLHNFCENEGYKGYSLYDSHNSPIPFKKLGRIPSFLVNQVNKRSPINFRPLLGVKKGINPKGYGLFLHSYSLLHSLDVLEKEKTAKLSEFFFKWLIDNPSPGYSGNCWGYNYHWPKKDGSDVPPYTPSVVVTGFVARSFYAYYQEFGDERVRKALRSATEFVLNDVHLYKGDEGYCFSYTPVKKDLTVNANLLAAEILAYCDAVHGENKFGHLIDKVIEFTLNVQNEDGSWYYSFDYNTRKPKKQIDFHQGYVLESLFRLSKHPTAFSKEIKEAINKGLSYYRKQQFDDSGLAYWRLPDKWPVDIHNQSQGIISFASFKEFDAANLPFAKKIASWTLANMRGKKGNFYYQKWPGIVNKVNYLRWNQGWMLLALVALLKEQVTIRK